MNANAPVTVNGQTYPVWQISLAISQNLQPNGDQPISFALRCVPARINESEEGVTVETLNTAAVSLYRGSEAEITDPVEKAAFAAIQQAVVSYLIARGL